MRPPTQPAIPLRARVAAPLADLLLGSAWLRERLRKSRSEPVEGEVLDPHMAAMLRLDDLTQDTDFVKAGYVKARRMLAESIPIVAAWPERRVETRDLTWAGPAGAQRARLYVPDDAPTPSPGLLFIHGGGWVTGDVDTHDSACHQLARHGSVRVLSIDYRLAPEHPFPAAAQDAVAAYRFAVEHAEDLGIDSQRLGVCGDSAGGNLSAVVSLHYAGDPIGPALAVLLYPALDARRALRSHETFARGWFLTRELVDWYYGHYLGDGVQGELDPRASPLLAPSHRDVCPTLLYPCHFDPLRDEAFAYAEKVRAAGGVAELHCFGSFIHGFALMNRASPAAQRALERVAHQVGDALRASRR